MEVGQSVTPTLNFFTPGSIPGSAGPRKFIDAGIRRRSDYIIG